MGWRSNRVLMMLLASAMMWALAPTVGAETVVQRTPQPQVPVLDWQPCGPDYPGFECATAIVPLDYDRPRGPKTEIALARFPAADPAAKLGSVFVNPGGPGGSGVGLVLAGFGEYLSANLGGAFDIVGFDPRGVGGSDPLHCFASEEELGLFFGTVPLFPYEQGQYRPYFTRYDSLYRQCRSQREAILPHMSTADVVRDLDRLREAVGDEKLTYLGFSYGSYIGNTYAHLFPDNVRALVIDGVLDPRLWSSGRQIDSDRIATQEVWDEFLRLCDEAESDCPFWEPTGSTDRWEALLAAVKATPVDLGDGFFYTYDFLVGDATGATYAPEVWDGPDGYAAFFDFLADVALGTSEPPPEMLVMREALIDRVTGKRAEADYDNFLDAYYGNQCADTQYPRTFREYMQIDRYAAAGSEFGPYWWWFNNGCSSWPVSPDRFAGPWGMSTSAPVLVVGNYFDPATDYAGAVASSQLLEGSRLLSYAGWGHTAYGRSACTTEHIDAYLLDGSLPPEGTVCPANPNPFLLDAGPVELSVPETPMVGVAPAWMFER